MGRESTQVPDFVPSFVVAENALISKIEEIPAPPALAGVRQAFAKIATIAPASERATVHPKTKVKRESLGARLLAYREPSDSWPAGW